MSREHGFPPDIRQASGTGDKHFAKILREGSPSSKSVPRVLRLLEDSSWYENTRSSMEEVCEGRVAFLEPDELYLAIVGGGVMSAMRDISRKLRRADPEDLARSIRRKAPRPFSESRLVKPAVLTVIPTKPRDRNLENSRNFRVYFKPAPEPVQDRVEVTRAINASIHHVLPWHEQFVQTMAVGERLRPLDDDMMQRLAMLFPGEFVLKPAEVVLEPIPDQPAA